MRKTALLIAGAIAFDLGVLVVSSHAASTSSAPALKADATTTTTHVHKANVALTTFEFLKFDMTTTLATCKAKGGAPATQGGVNGCLVPKADANSAMQDVSTTR